MVAASYKDRPMMACSTPVVMLENKREAEPGLHHNQRRFVQNGSVIHAWRDAEEGQNGVVDHPKGVVKHSGKHRDG